MPNKILNKAGFLIFAPAKKGGLEFLSLVVRHSVTKKRHYDFPKGHIESGETHLETAVREVAEEVQSASELHIIEGFNHSTKYTNSRGQVIKIRWYVGFLTPESLRTGKGIPAAMRYAYARDKVHEKSLRPSAEHEKVVFVPPNKAKATFLKERLVAVKAAQAFLEERGFTAPAKATIFPRHRTISGKKYKTYYSRRKR